MQLPPYGTETFNIDLLQKKLLLKRDEIDEENVKIRNQDFYTDQNEIKPNLLSMPMSFQSYRVCCCWLKMGGKNKQMKNIM